MTRHRLPSRRPSLTEQIAHNEQAYHVTVGFDDGRPLEVFCHGAKVGSDMDALIDDACIVISLSLQSGQSARDLVARLQRHEREGDEGDAADSLIAAIIAVVAQHEGEPVSTDTDLIVLVRDLRVAIVKLGDALYIIGDEGDAPGFQRLDNEFVDLPDNSLGPLLWDCIDELDENDGWLDLYDPPDEYTEAAARILAWMRADDWFEGIQREEDAARMVRDYVRGNLGPDAERAMLAQIEGWIEKVLR